MGFIFLAFLIFALNQGREWGWTSGAIIGCLIGFVVTFVLFLWWEWRDTNSAIDLGLFRNPAFGLSTLGISLLLFVGAGSRFLFPIHVQWFEGLSVQDAGFVLMAMAAGLAVTTLQAQRLARRFYVRDLCVAGLLIAAAGLSTFVFAGHQTPVWVFAVAMAVVGFGLGMHYPQTMRLAMQSVPEDNSIKAATAMSSVRSVAQLLGIVAFETVFSQIYLKPSDLHYGSSTNAESLSQMTTSFHLAFAIGVVLCLAALVPLLFLPRSETEMANL